MVEEYLHFSNFFGLFIPISFWNCCLLDVLVFKNKNKFLPLQQPLFLNMDESKILSPGKGLILS